VGETITLWAVGLGVPAAGVPPTGTAPSSPIAIPSSLGSVNFSYPYPVTSGTLSGGIPSTTATSQTTVEPSFVGLVPGYVGLYQINITVPPAPSGIYASCQYTANVALSTNAVYQNPAAFTINICVQP
jgi:hypothetical protein